MDILEQKQHNLFNDNIKKLMKQLTFLKNPIEIKGSSSLKSQRYFSDYDFLSNIKKKIRYIILTMNLLK